MGKELTINGESPEYAPRTAPRHAEYYAVDENKTFHEFKRDIIELIKSNNMESWQLAGHMLVLGSQQLSGVDLSNFPGETYELFIKQLEAERNDPDHEDDRFQRAVLWQELGFDDFCEIDEAEFRKIYNERMEDYNRQTVNVNYC
jgi:hypothetical protein